MIVELTERDAQIIRGALAYFAHCRAEAARQARENPALAEFGDECERDVAAAHKLIPRLFRP